MNPDIDAWSLADSAKDMDILNYEEELDGEAILGAYEVSKSIKFLIMVIWDFHILIISPLPHGSQKLLSSQGYSLFPLVKEISDLHPGIKGVLHLSSLFKGGLDVPFMWGAHIIPDIIECTSDIILKKWDPDFHFSKL